jgi:hypothetical protein
MNTKDGDQEVTDNSAYNPFPEPQTIPSGWDTSTLSFTPQSDSAMDEDSLAEN